MDSVLFEEIGTRNGHEIYKKEIKLVAAIDKGKELPFFSILEAMKILDLAGQKVKRFTIIYCFAKAEISNEQQKSA